MKIKKVIVENIQKIKYAEIESGGLDVIVLCGRNKQGKTSFLNGFQSVFEGKNSLPELPINNSSDNGRTVVTLDNGMVLERTITPKGTALTVKDTDGKSISSPQKYVEEKLKLFSFNPLDFSAGDIKSQKKYVSDILRIAVGNDCSSFQDILDEYSSIKKEALFPNKTYFAARLENKNSIEVIDELINPTNGVIYMERRDVGRDIKTLSVGIKKGLVDNTKKIKQLEDEYTGLKEQHKLMKISSKKTKNVWDEFDTFKESFTKLCSVIPKPIKSIAMTDIVNMKEKIDVGFNYVDNYLAIQERANKKDSDDLEKRFRDLAEIRADQKIFDSQAKTEKLLSEAKTSYDQAEKDIKHLSDCKKEILANTELPVPGLDVREEGVYVDSIPYATGCSQAEKLIIAIRLSMALNPELRVCRITDGNCLDKESFEELGKLAEKEDFQVWIEIVQDSDDGAGFYFVDGHIVD